MSMSWLEKAQDLKIPFEKIELATDKFKSCIGNGGFGDVFKGELTLSGGGLATVAVKRLGGQFQGLKEFMMEIQLLSRYKHPNLISLLGFCDENNEKILVYEYAEHGSLDKYLRSSNATHCLTWIQRLKICVGAACGLDHLHNGAAESHRIIHRDIKSSNILLDQNWNALISDFGLSKIGLTDVDNSLIISNVCGTLGYVDPAYLRTGILTKESDVYSFGIVLFEVLCGRPCFSNHQDERESLGPLAKSCYENKKLDVIIDPKLRAQMDSNSLETFSSIAYQCLLDDRRQRPQMRVIVEKLEDALEYQEKYEFEKNKELLRKSIADIETDTDAYWEQKLPRDYEDIVERLDSPVTFATKKELFSLLRQGILFDGGTRLLRLDDNGEKCEMVAATEFLDPQSIIYSWESIPGTRFAKVAQILDASLLRLRIQVKPRFLSTGIMYAANLVFRFPHDPDIKPGIPVYMGLRCEFEEADMSWTSHDAEWIDDGWLVLELWHFISHEKNPEFEVLVRDYSDGGYAICIAGIEFQPLHIMEDEERIALEVEGSLADTEWEKKLPSDYQEIIDRADHTLNNTSKKEIYFLLCDGILIDNGRMWFAISKLNGKKCYALPADEAIDEDYSFGQWAWVPLPGSRFKKVATLKSSQLLTLECKIRSNMLSEGAAYSCHLIYKLSDSSHGFESGLKAACTLNYKSQGLFRVVHFASKSPMLKPKNEKTTTLESSTIPNIKGLPKQRKDGWMETLLWEFADSSLLDGNPGLCLDMFSDMGRFSGIIMEAIEFRPIC